MILLFMCMPLLLLHSSIDDHELLACGDDVTVGDDNKLFRSNVWRRLGEGGQCLIPDGWTWGWADVGYDVQAFPSVVIGRSPWAERSTDSRFPVKVGDLRRLEVQVDIRTTASGEFNTVMDLWLTDNKHSGPDGIRAELMIWLVRGTMNPVGTSRGKRSVGNDTYELFVGDVEGAVYAAFVSQAKVSSGNVDLLALVQVLVEEGIISDNWYISVLELGNEVVSGSGQSLVETYSATVELR